jgi:hypothetical protein
MASGKARLRFKAANISGLKKYFVETLPTNKQWNIQFSEENQNTIHIISITTQQ